MYDNQLDYRAIQKRADAAIKRQQTRTRLGLFAVNALLYIMSMVFIWGIFITHDYFSSLVFAALIVMSAEWTVGVILHGASLWLSSEKGTRRMRERFLTREIAREMARLGLDDDESPGWNEKSKRREHLLDDDDEAVQLADLIDREPIFREDLK